MKVAQSWGQPCTAKDKLEKDSWYSEDVLVEIEVECVMLVRSLGYQMCTAKKCAKEIGWDGGEVGVKRVCEIGFV